QEPVSLPISLVPSHSLAAFARRLLLPPLDGFVQFSLFALLIFGRERRAIHCHQFAVGGSQNHSHFIGFAASVFVFILLEVGIIRRSLPIGLVGFRGALNNGLHVDLADGSGEQDHCEKGSNAGNRPMASGDRGSPGSKTRWPLLSEAMKARLQPPC